MRPVDEEMISEYLVKWKPLLSLSDWDIRPVIVKKEWRKSDDVKLSSPGTIAPSSTSIAISSSTRK